MIGIKTENPKGKGFKTAFPEKNKYHIPNYRHYTEYDQRLAHILSGMKYRCNNPSCKAYKYYGGKTPPVKVCEQWDNDFDGTYNFIDWAYDSGYYEQPKGTPKNDLLSIERLDPNGDYCPENCIWIPGKMQNRNKTSSVFYTYCGETRDMGEWAEITGIKLGTLLKRYHSGKSASEIFDTRSSCEKEYCFNDTQYTMRELIELTGHSRSTLKDRIKAGWTFDELFLPINSKVNNSHYIEYNGYRLTVADWSRIVGLSAPAIYHRQDAGWSAEETLCCPPHTKSSMRHTIKHNGKFPNGWYIKDGHFYDENGFMRLVFRR